MSEPGAVALPEVLVPEPTGQGDVSERNHYDSMMRAQANALDQLTKQVIVAEPRPRDGLQSALSRIEARLCVTEQSLAALDVRVSERMKGLDGDTSTLGERLHGLRQRLEKFEEKQVTALAQLRLDVHNLRHTPSAEPSIEPPEPVETAAPIEAETTLSDEVPRAEVLLDDDKHTATYLDAARKAANDAAARNAAIAAKRQQRAKRSWSRKRWLVLVIATVAVAWFDAYVFAHYQIAQGAVTEQAPALRQHVLTPRAQLIRGLRYKNGVGVAVDNLRAKAWIERAALGGDPVAENLMGVMAQSDENANTVVAVGWYETAARHGNVKAMANLGKLYAGGWKQGTDFAKAADWFQKAAEAGEVDAAFNLAVLCESGLGRARNIAEAYRWYAIAAGSGDHNAASRATVLAGKIAPAQRDALDRAILGFKPAPQSRAANDVPALKG